MSSYHGWTHAPKAQGGTDPIPGAATSSRMWPMSYELLKWDMQAGFDVEHSPFFSNDIINPGDAGSEAYVNGWAWGDTRDNANFLAYLRLGPKGSLWGVNILASAFDDGGILDLSWQTSSEDATGQSYDLDGLGMLPGSTDLPDSWPNSRTYYHASMEGGGAASRPDFYSGGGGQVDHVFTTGLAQFRIMGEDGDPITQDATYDASDDLWHFDGGSGIWVLKVETDGKNPSSSGFRNQLESLIVRRITSDGFYAG